MNKNSDYWRDLVCTQCKLQKECEWVEFKQNMADPEDIGEYISALANSAALQRKNAAYLIWGISDNDHSIVGTNFHPSSVKIGNEELENWLLRHIEPKINFSFHEISIDSKIIIVLEISPAIRHPVRFKSQEFFRVGSYKKNLKNYPEHERSLWRILDHTPFERLIAKEHISSDIVLRLLDYPAYFDFLDITVPDGHTAILNSLLDDNIIQQCDAGCWNITNLGAILFAKRLNDFSTLSRKAIRVIQYKGSSRIETIIEQTADKGYACGFEELIRTISTLIPANEVIEQALRKNTQMYPELAIRELIANALIHQDFFERGTGPMFEIFEDCIEITNPGKPIVDAERFLDTPPKSRNEALASLLRRFGICEERGSGIDKVVLQTELCLLPAPLFEVPGDFTRVTLFSPRPLSAMTKADRIRACYLHACLRYVDRDYLSNSSLRQRFGIEEQNRSMVSRLIREAANAGAIIPYERDASPKHMKYMPWWAGADKS